MSSVLCDYAVRQLVDEGRLTLEDLVTLEQWLRENRNKVPPLEAEQIAMFLLAWSNDIEKTKNAIKINYRIRREHPEIFGDRGMQDKEVQKAASVLLLTSFPEKTLEGYDIFFGRIIDPVYSNLDMVPCLKLIGMSIDVTLKQYPPRGVIILLDMKLMSIMHLTRIKFNLLRPIFQYILGALNFKLIRVHILNTAYFLDKLMALISPFLSAEFIDLLHFHPPGMDMEEFYKTYIPKHCLPEDYGGDLPSVQSMHDANMEKLTALQHYFDEEENQRTDKSEI